MLDQFQVVDRSTSGHCCFDFTVVDTGHEVFPADEFGPAIHGALCETFDEDSATRIAAALNSATEAAAIIAALMERMDWMGTGSTASGDTERAEFEKRIAAAGLTVSE